MNANETTTATPEAPKPSNKDAAGNRLGTVKAAAYAALTTELRDIKAITESAKLPWPPFNHLNDMVKKGFAIKGETADGKVGYALPPTAEPKAKKGKGKGKKAGAAKPKSKGKKGAEPTTTENAAPVAEPVLTPAVA